MSEAYKIGKKKLSITLPTGWHEVPFNQAIKVLEGNQTEVQTLAMLAGIDERELRATTDMETIVYFLNSFRFLGRLPDLEMGQAFPKSVKINGDLQMLPWVAMSDAEDLGNCSFGQVDDMLTVMRGNLDPEKKKELTLMDSFKIMPQLCAIYLYPLYHDGKYDAKLALKWAEELEKGMNFKEVYIMGSFFLQRVAGLMTGSQAKLLKSPTILKKLRRGLRNLTRRLVHMLRLT